MIDNKLAIEALERGREQNTERATHLLHHYFKQALPPGDESDTRAELKECVEAIVDAAAFAVRRSYLSAKTPSPQEALP